MVQGEEVDVTCGARDGYREFGGKYKVTDDESVGFRIRLVNIDRSVNCL